MAAEQLAANLAMFLGLGLAGILISQIGVQPTMTALGLIVMTVGATLYLADRRARRAHPENVDAPVEPEASPALV